MGDLFEKWTDSMTTPDELFAQGWDNLLGQCRNLYAMDEAFRHDGTPEYVAHKIWTELHQL